jgi:hypothetical protein
MAPLPAITVRASARLTAPQVYHAVDDPAGDAPKLQSAGVGLHGSQILSDAVAEDRSRNTFGE